MKHFIFDFDSTIVQAEALDELADIALKNHPNRKELINKIEDFTVQGMQGTLPINESYKKRFALFKAEKQHLAQLIPRLIKKLSPSFKRNKHFFKKYHASIHIISNGFREVIIPVVAKLGIAPEQVHANSLTINNNIVAYDPKSILANPGGKEKVLRSLDLEGDVYIIGDGFSDYQMKNGHKNARFFAFTETAYRDRAVSRADSVVKSFDEFLFINQLPMTISYPKNRIKVLVLENIDTNAITHFRDEGYDVETVKKALSEEELIAHIANVSLLCIRSKTKVTKKVIAHANRLLGIGAFCIGTDQIDLEACSDKGIAVFNAPYSNTRSVVELALAQMILLMRNAYARSIHAKQGRWSKSAQDSNEVRGKTLGIIGYGNIGSQLSILAEAMGMQVIYYDVLEKLAMGNARKCRTMTELLKKSDIITVHVSGDKKNKKLIGEKEFKLMKQGVVFLNLSRGFVVDLDALVHNLANNKIRGAAIDVYPQEPSSNKDPFLTPLQRFDNVILTPHVGGSTIEAQHNIAEFVADKLINYINNGSSFGSVNIPELQLPQLKNAHRLLHIHRNVPGILAHINNVIADHKSNIVGQYLKTNEQIGYVITDIDKKYQKEVLSQLREIHHTIRFRVLY